jgi:hypothetical protein
MVSFVMTTMAGLAFRSRLLNGCIVIVYDDDRITISSLALLVLGMARVGGAWVMRVIRILGPALFIAAVARSLAVLYNNDLAGVAVFLAGGCTGGHGGNREYNQEEESKALHDNICIEFESENAFVAHKSIQSTAYTTSQQLILSAIILKA